MAGRHKFLLTCQGTANHGAEHYKFHQSQGRTPQYSLDMPGRSQSQSGTTQISFDMSGPSQSQGGTLKISVDMPWPSQSQGRTPQISLDMPGPLQSQSETQYLLRNAAQFAKKPQKNQRHISISET